MSRAAGREMSLPSWELLSEPELLQAWAMNLMVINVSTRKYARAVRLPDDAGGDLSAASGDATSKSAVSRRFVALTRSKLKAWLASPLDDLDLVVLQIDGLHVGDHLMVAAIGIDTGGAKHVLGLAEGATENAATVQAMLDNLIERGLDPERPRLYIVDGARRNPRMSSAPSLNPIPLNSSAASGTPAAPKASRKSASRHLSATIRAGRPNRSSAVCSSAFTSTVWRPKAVGGG